MKYALIFLLLTGCASPRLVTSTPRTVILENSVSRTMGQSQAIADSECAKHGRYAVHIPDSQRDGIVTYECVQ